MSAEVALRMRPVRAGVIDVGSNTVRLLVAARTKRGLQSVLSERTYVGLAKDIERTRSVSYEKLAALGALVERYAAVARASGIDALEVIVTAPGRQSANAAELVDVLESAAGAPVRQLTAEEEGRLAYAGAVGACSSVPETIAVVDVGGGSTQLMVGTAEEPAWLRCLDIGSLRLTERIVRSDPPGDEALEALADSVSYAFEGLAPPLPLKALATGGTARTLRRIVGRRLGEKNLSAALEDFASTPAAALSDRYDLLVERARVLAAGTIVLREAHRRLGVKLEVARGGVREGAVRAMLAELAAAAA
jgi:exopolyphosphatase / guanosine-5'-triphosphate,3'-diphosphate pyrophosphatase